MPKMLPDHALVKLLTDTVEGRVSERFERVMRLKREAAEGGGVKDMREYVEAMLGLEVYSHKLYECAHAEPHDHAAYSNLQKG